MPNYLVLRTKWYSVEEILLVIDNSEKISVLLRMLWENVDLSLYLLKWAIYPIIIVYLT